ncbi:hypothetical protein B0H10DRAFT_1963220 [Mycena sp. CBHHK59/15]|nr:hypothetical protein B0H10DRAFT_1963220 [Mycena sp. CBHHK59/15]
MSHEQWDVALEPQAVQVDRQWVLPTTEQHAAVQIQLAYGYRKYHTIQAASLRAAGTDVPLGSLNRISGLVIMTRGQEVQPESRSRRRLETGKGPEAKIWLFSQAPQLRRVYDCLAVKPGLEWKHSMTGKSDPSRATLEKATRLNALPRNEGQVPGDKLEETGVLSEWRGNQRDDQRCTGGQMEAKAKDEEERREPEMDQKMDQ